MRLALAQINPTIGAIEGNARLVIDFATRAAAERADLVVFPELCLTGYPPKDLLLQEGFVGAVERVVGALAERLPRGVSVVVGAPLTAGWGNTKAPITGGAGDRRHGGGAGGQDVRPTGSPPRRSGAERARPTNSLVVYRDGAIIARYDKRLLPTYDVFDENRYFVAGGAAVVVDVPVGGGAGVVRVGLSVCEDLWRGLDAGFSERYMDGPDPVEELCRAGAEVIVNPSASPFVLGKGSKHRAILAHHAKRWGVVMAAVNQVGGNDELVFDGAAAVVGADGAVVAAARAFEEELLVVEVRGGTGRRALGAGEASTSGARHEDTKPESTTLGGAPRVAALGGQDVRPTGMNPAMKEEEALFRALVLGVRDYCRKTGFKSAVLGLSGGIDSAVVAVLAAAALGPRAVTGISMPSRYSSQGSKDDAHELAQNLGIHYETIAIEGPFGALLDAARPAMGNKPADVTEENLQSRVRGTLLMAISNKHGHILLTTGNKSELAVGYCTLYGDMNGGLAVISDVGKIMVYRLARWMNEHAGELGIAGLGARMKSGGAGPIPEASLTKAPSAELRENQTDQDTLPPYHVLDEIIERYVERRESPARIATEMGGDVETLATVKRVVRMIDLAEYKRKQAPIGLKVSGVAFGSGRRMPVAQGWRPGVGMA